VLLSQVAEGFVSLAKEGPRELHLPLGQIRSRYPDFDGELGMKLYKPIFWYLVSSDGPIGCGGDSTGTLWHLKDPKATFDKGYFESVAEAVFGKYREYLLCNYHGVQKMEDIPKQ